MKRIFGLLLMLGIVGVSARAQSTMPAMGVNTPKGQVAKTDASLNQTGGMDKSNTGTTKTSTSSKKMRKTKTTKIKSTSTM